MQLYTHRICLPYILCHCTAQTGMLFMQLYTHREDVFSHPVSLYSANQDADYAVPHSQRGRLSPSSVTVQRKPACCLCSCTLTERTSFHTLYHCTAQTQMPMMQLYTHREDVFSHPVSLYSANQDAVYAVVHSQRGCGHDECSTAGSLACTGCALCCSRLWQQHGPPQDCLPRECTCPVNVPCPVSVPALPECPALYPCPPGQCALPCQRALPCQIALPCQSALPCQCECLRL